MLVNLNWDVALMADQENCLTCDNKGFFFYKRYTFKRIVAWNVTIKWTRSASQNDTVAEMKIIDI